jgi:hypothetical protein
MARPTTIRPNGSRPIATPRVNCFVGAKSPYPTVANETLDETNIFRKEDQKRAIEKFCAQLVFE